MTRTVRIDDDIWEYLKDRGKFGDTPSDIFRRELPDFPKLKRPPVVTRSNGAKDVLKADRDYTNVPVSGYEFEGKYVSVRTFKEVLVGICNTLRKTHAQSFDALAVGLHGKKRTYFSGDENALKHPRKLEWNGTVTADLFVESNMNASSIVGLCRYLIKALGHDVSTFKVR